MCCVVLGGGGAGGVWGVGGWLVGGFMVFDWWLLAVILWLPGGCLVSCFQCLVFLMPVNHQATSNQRQIQDQQQPAIDKQPMNR